MNQHPFQNYLICRNNYFSNPIKIVALAHRQQYSSLPICPGLRTENLLDSKDYETRNFALTFAKRIKTDVFPSIRNFLIDIRFHKNFHYDNSDANYGWIHNDEADLAGVVYLNPAESNFESGTSFFNKISKEEFQSDDFDARLKFNLDNVVTEQYLDNLKSNWSQFDESIRVGNQFNRLIGYDAKLFHRPNYFKTILGDQRLCLIFFIQKFEFIETKIIDYYE